MDENLTLEEPKDKDEPGQEKNDSFSSNNEKVEVFNRFQYEALLEVVKESINLNKELLKLVLGLATGTLVFSVTFVDKLGPELNHKWILGIGWGCLLASILAGVTFISLAFKRYTFIKSYPELEKVIDGVAGSKNVLKEALKKVTNWNEDQAKLAAEMYFKPEHWKKRAKSDNNEEDKKTSKIMYKLVSILERFTRKHVGAKSDFSLKLITALIRQISIWENVSIALGYVTQWAFFSGIVLIALFAYLNF